jgi:hypothetical protein
MLGPPYQLAPAVRIGLKAIPWPYVEVADAV